MDKPAGFLVEGQEGNVCKPLISLYGLKEAPKQWHKKFDKILKSAGFAMNEADLYIYVLSLWCEIRSVHVLVRP